MSRGAGIVDALCAVWLCFALGVVAVALVLEAFISHPVATCAVAFLILVVSPVAYLFVRWMEGAYD